MNFFCVRLAAQSFNIYAAMDAVQYAAWRKMD